ncbi:MAG: hypothetical protein JW995_16115 [Melioribacteraceae bacterium]|nr:hypothetical protein [Melioribacteraceae bacterium]
MLKSLNSIIKNLPEKNFPSVSDFRRLFDHLRQFENINKYLTRLAELKKKKDLIGKLTLVRSTEIYLKEIPVRIYNNFKKEAGNIKSLITLSNSNTVFHVLLKIHSESPKLNIFISESRPVLEGRILAEELARNNISCTILTESQIPLMIPEIDCAVIGADRILKNGDVVNKAGSMILAVACKYFRKPLFVLTDQTKYSEQTNFKPKNYPTDEVWSKRDSKIVIKNYYFELIPRDLITNIITD